MSYYSSKHSQAGGYPNPVYYTVDEPVYRAPQYAQPRHVSGSGPPAKRAPSGMSTGTKVMLLVLGIALLLAAIATAVALTVLRVNEAPTTKDTSPGSGSGDSTGGASSGDVRKYKTPTTITYGADACPASQGLEEGVTDALSDQCTSGDCEIDPPKVSCAPSGSTRRRKRAILYKFTITIKILILTRTTSRANSVVLSITKSARITTSRLYKFQVKYAFTLVGVKATAPKTSCDLTDGIRVKRKKTSLCCGILGCFNKDSPFDEWPLPDGPTDLNITLELRSRTKNKTFDCPSDIVDSVKNVKGNDVFIIIHDIADLLPVTWVRNLTEHLLKENTTIIEVYWKTTLYYNQTASNVRILAAILQQVLGKEAFQDSRKHCIGHGLGAHVCGIAGIKAGFLRITGLNPTGLGFSGFPIKWRLDSTDAKFVDVIHSDCFGGAYFNIGSLVTFGHVDFYPNGGKNPQPSCNTTTATPSGGAQTRRKRTPAKKEDNMVCFVCNTESPAACNASTATETCQGNGQFICSTEVKEVGGELKVTKGCRNKNACNTLTLKNPSSCKDGEVDRSCIYCCDDTDKCNVDSQEYKIANTTSEDGCEEWSPWSACDKLCNNGTRTRTRKCNPAKSKEDSSKEKDCSKGSKSKGKKGKGSKDDDCNDSKEKKGSKEKDCSKGSKSKGKKSKGSKDDDCDDSNDSKGKGKGSKEKGSKEKGGRVKRHKKKDSKEDSKGKGSRGKGSKQDSKGKDSKADSKGKDSKGKDSNEKGSKSKGSKSKGSKESKENSSKGNSREIETQTGTCNTMTCEELACSHNQAVWYFLESVTSQFAFLSTSCNEIAIKQGTCNKTCNGSDCQLMGMNSVNMDANGTFYLETKDSSPYSKPQDTIPFTSEEFMMTFRFEIDSSSPCPDTNGTNAIVTTFVTQWNTLTKYIEAGVTFGGINVYCSAAATGATVRRRRQAVSTVKGKGSLWGKTKEVLKEAAEALMTLTDSLLAPGDIVRRWFDDPAPTCVVMNDVKRTGRLGAVGVGIVTYGILGKFTSALGSIPFGTLPLPNAPKHIAPDVRVFNAANKGGVCMGTSGLDLTKKTKIIIHGYRDNANTWVKAMKDAFLDKACSDCNVIAVDWSRGARISLGTRIYGQAAANTRMIGRIIASVINDKIPLDNVHCIGHSLGAHTCAFASSDLPKTGGIFDRITGMDAAGPSFAGRDASARLDPTDATAVDAIHTDMGSLFALDWGITETVGHIDFYPNYGIDQPGCKGVACSHGRAIEYFLESLTSTCKFTASPCSFEDIKKKTCSATACTGAGCQVMGYDTDRTKTGTFFLETNSKSPFCKGASPAPTAAPTTGMTPTITSTTAAPGTTLPATDQPCWDVQGFCDGRYTCASPGTTVNQPPHLCSKAGYICCKHVTDDNCRNLKGVCKDEAAETCSGGNYVVGKCAGPVWRKCCVPSA